MKVHFILKGKNNPTKIVCRFKINQSKDFFCTTNFIVYRENWDIKKQKLKIKAEIQNKDEINQKLRLLENQIIDTYNKFTLEKKEFSKNWLKEIVYNFLGQVQVDTVDRFYFCDWVQSFIDSANKRLYKGSPITQKTILQYKSTLQKIRAYEKQNTKLKFENIDLKFYYNFVDYLRNFELLADNTIGSNIKRIKLWCKNIEIEGLPISPHYKLSEFSAIQGTTNDVYLTEKEIESVYKHDFSDNERLNNIRDTFIIGLRTGLRISDFMRLQKLNIVDNKIEITTTKTNQSVVIPMHVQVKNILQQRNGDPPPNISDQKFNLYVKEVCEIVGLTEMVSGAKMINKNDDVDFFPSPNDIKNKTRKQKGVFKKFELVSSHTCRRSFASNLYGKIPNGVIMAISTHKTESQFLKYIKITPTENAKKLQEYWDKMLENELSS